MTITMHHTGVAECLFTLRYVAIVLRPVESRLSHRRPAIGTGVMISATVLAVSFVPVFFTVIIGLVDKLSRRKRASRVKGKVMPAE